MREGTPKIDIYNLFSTFLPGQIMIDARGFFNE